MVLRTGSWEKKFIIMDNATTLLQKKKPCPSLTSTFEWRNTSFLLQVRTKVLVVVSAESVACHVSTCWLRAFVAVSLAYLAVAWIRKPPLGLPRGNSTSIAILPNSESALECVSYDSKTLPRACAAKPALESSLSYGDRQPFCLVAKSVRCKASSRVSAFVRWPAEIKTRTTHVQRSTRGSHHSSQGQPACSVHATGSTQGKSRSTRVEPTRNGAHTNQSTDNPRAAYTHGVHISQGKEYPRVRRYGVHANRSTDYPRGARATGSTPVHPRTTPGSKGYFGPINEHTYRSNLF